MFDWTLILSIGSGVQICEVREAADRTKGTSSVSKSLMTNRQLQRLLAGVATMIAIPLAAQVPETVTEPEAYALYSLLVPPYWNRRMEGILLLQRETEAPSYSCAKPRAPTGDWQSVVEEFHRQNARVQLLQPLVTTKTPYRLISRAEIEADDARLAIKYPGGYQRRPESMDYAAVSAVGFNADKSKAILYVRVRDQGEIYFMEKRDGTWVRASIPSCGWIA